jgi:hypothetical protein
MSKSLFIGGDLDGKRMSVPDEQYIKHQRLKPPSIFADSSRNESRVEIETYHQQLFVAGEQRFFLYVFDKLSAASALQMLIDNYKPEKP